MFSVYQWISWPGAGKVVEQIGVACWAAHSRALGTQRQGSQRAEDQFSTSTRSLCDSFHSFTTGDYFLSSPLLLWENSCTVIIYPLSFKLPILILPSLSLPSSSSPSQSFHVYLSKDIGYLYLANIRRTASSLMYFLHLVYFNFQNTNNDEHNHQFKTARTAFVMFLLFISKWQTSKLLF